MDLRWVLAFAAMGMALFPAASQAQQGPKRPHLVITSMKAADDEQKPFHRFWHGAPLELTVTIKNKGRGMRRSDSFRFGVVSSKPGEGLGFTLEHHFDLPRLGAGDKREVSVFAFGRVPRRDDEIGTAQPKVCVPMSGVANVDQRGNLTGRRSCDQGPSFAVIPRTWSGTMSVTQPIFGFAKLESIASPRFRYAPNVSENTKQFVWGGAGDLIHTASGSNATCSISGSKNSRIRLGEAPLVLPTSLLEYRGRMGTTDTLQAMQTCGIGPAIPLQLRTTSIFIPSKDRNENETTLQGTNSSGGATYKWDLEAN